MHARHAASCISRGAIGDLFFLARQLLHSRGVLATQTHDGPGHVNFGNEN